MKRYSLALDLKDDEALIADYEEYHRNVWPEILTSIKDAGIEKMEIYRISNRLFMIMETNDEFTFERKAAMDSANERVKEREELMGKLQQPLPGSKPAGKWRLMNKIVE